MNGIKEYRAIVLLAARRPDPANMGEVVVWISCCFDSEDIMSRRCEEKRPN